MRVAERMDVPHGARDVAGRNLENRRAERSVQITCCARLNLAVSALLNERREPADLELAADGNQQVCFLELQDEARLRFDEMRILIAFRDRVDGRAIAGHLARNRREILRRRDDVQLALRLRWGGHDDRHNQKHNAFHLSPLLVPSP